MRRQLDLAEEETNYVKEKMTPADLKAGDTKRSLDIKSPVVINYAKVQSKASLKHGSWHKDALGKF